LNRKNLLLALPILSFIWFAGTLVIAGLAYPDYSHASQFISELGAPGSPHGNYVNYLGFIPTELFILAFVFTCLTVMPKTKRHLTGLAFIAVYGITLGIAAVFPCDFECNPAEPTFSHNVHMLSAFPGYLCGIIALFILSSSGQSKAFKTVSFFIGALCIFAFLNLAPESAVVGVYQRSLDSLIYLWLIYFGFTMRQYLPNK
jgi:hypothetical membrane protein